MGGAWGLGGRAGPGTVAAMTAFELRVEGVLANPTVHHLGCLSRVVGPQTVLRIEATPGALRDLVDDCSRRGRTIESIVRIDPR